jgi:hypothetical protein
MELLSSEIVVMDSFLTLNDLVRAVNEFAGSQGYAVIKKRTKLSKKGVLRKAVLKCDKEGNGKLQEYGKRVISTRQCDCSFEAVATLSLDDER